MVPESSQGCSPALLCNKGKGRHTRLVSVKTISEVLRSDAVKLGPVAKAIEKVRWVQLMLEMSSGGLSSKMSRNTNCFQHELALILCGCAIKHVHLVISSHLVYRHAQGTH